MATADDTARARPTLHPRAKSHAPTDIPAHTPTLSDVKLGAQAIVRVLAHGVAACDPHDIHSMGVLRHPWWKHKRTIEGLSAALTILHEHGDALRREEEEGPGA